MQSCGVADVIASSFAGRNSKCAAEFIQRLLKHESVGNKNDLIDCNSGIVGENSINLQELWDTIELEVLNGQKLQGLSTCDEVIKCIEYYESKYGLATIKFPLFRRVYEIARNNAKPNTLFQWN